MKKGVNYRDALKKKRTIIDLPDEDLKRLDDLADENSVPRATVLREAVAEYVVRKGKAPSTPKPLAGFGALKGYYGDAQAYQDELRGEWE
ncbi:ribbon-helix-helix domain-containing protein [Luteolibacter soli]|uniref:CopG family transcriptional regulator n=1 Tax=Luteolibacter soli TaxID=3135280 RepID=A0ABU9B1M1_9BACT